MGMRRTLRWTFRDLWGPWCNFCWTRVGKFEHSILLTTPTPRHSQTLPDTPRPRRHVVRNTHECFLRRLLWEFFTHPRHRTRDFTKSILGREVRDAILWELDQTNFQGSTGYLMRIFLHRLVLVRISGKTSCSRIFQKIRWYLPENRDSGYIEKIFAFSVDGDFLDITTRISDFPIGSQESNIDHPHHR